MTDNTELRKLDAEVAEKVMGLQEVEFVGGVPKYHNTILDSERGGRWSSPVCRYSTDIAAAFTVVEKMWPDYQVEMVNCFKQGTLVANKERAWWVRFINNEYDMDNWSADADTLPLAICRAALAATKSTDE